jgi:hypothetical protein
MTRSIHLCFAMLAGAIAFGVQAQEAPAPGSTDTGTPRVKIEARKNEGDIPQYEHFIKSQGWVYNELPPRPRVIDFLWRISFTDLPEPERDAFVPKEWAVALVGRDFEQTVPVARGGYFLLPVLPQGRWGATIMFNAQTRSERLAVAWAIRLSADKQLRYADFGRALEEVRGVQIAMPPTWEFVREIRNANYDALKACFLDAGSDIFIDGKQVSSQAVGNCKILKYDPTQFVGTQTIEFRGPLNVVTLVDTEARRRAGY